MLPSATKRLGSAPGRTPANKGQRYRAEVLAEAEVNAIIGSGSAVSLTGHRNRALIIILAGVACGSLRRWAPSGRY